MQNQAATAEYATQVTVVSERARAIETALAQSEKRILQLEETVRTHGQNEATRLESFEQVNVEVGRLRGDIEQLRFQLKAIQEELARGAVDRERRMLHGELRLEAIESMLSLKPPPAPTDEELGVARGEVPAVVPEGAGTKRSEKDSGEKNVADAATSAAEKLRLANEHLRAGRPAVARALLEVALKEHPGAAETPEIRYRIAKAWFAEENYGKAGKAYQSVLDNHGSSEWAPWAMFGQGECFEKLGKADTARVFFESVVDKYPNTPATKEAKSKLKK
jgi:TolA-binding protein